MIFILIHSSLLSLSLFVVVVVAVVVAVGVASCQASHLRLPLLPLMMLMQVLVQVLETRCNHATRAPSSCISTDAASCSQLSSSMQQAQGRELSLPQRALRFLSLSLSL